jgi:hypothetical protein
MKFALPHHMRVYEREGIRWFAYDPTQVIFNSTDQLLHLQQVEQEFGLTEERLTIALFRINGGKPGLYLANLKDKKYYYCGSSWDDVKATLLNLGIGRTDPMEGEC